MKVCGLLVKLLLLAGCSALIECGNGTSVDMNDLDVNCEKLNGSLSLALLSDFDYEKTFMLREVTRNLSVYSNNYIDYKFSWPLKVSKLRFPHAVWYNSYTFNVSKIIAEEIEIDRLETEELIIGEPVIFKWKSGTIYKLSGIKGTRLKHIELGDGVVCPNSFDNITRLDSLVFNRHADSAFPNLTYVKYMSFKDAIRWIDFAIQSAGKVEVDYDYREGKIVFNNLTTVEDVIQVSGDLFLFSAPKLTRGRLEIEHARELKLNKSLTWNGVSKINGYNFCKDYFKVFVESGLAFQTDKRCPVDCDIPYTPKNLTLYMACKEFKTIEITQHSVEYIPLYEATTIAGDLRLINYSGTFYAPRLYEIIGNVIINSKNFFFTAPDLNKIQGSLLLHNSSSLSSSSLKAIQGSVFLHNASSFSAPLLNKIQGSLILHNSSSLSSSSLNIIQGSLTIINSTISALTLDEVQDSVFIKNSNGFSFPKLKKIKGNLNITNSFTSTSQALFYLESVESIHFHQQTNNVEFNSLNSIHTLRIQNSSLDRITGIAVTEMEELSIEASPSLIAMPLPNLHKVNNAYISAAGIGDISHIFSVFFNVTNQITITDFQHDQMHLHLLSAGQLTLKDNPNLEVIHLKAKYLDPPIETINNPKLRVAKFKHMNINYKLQNKQFKVLTASTEKEPQSQSTPDTDGAADKNTSTRKVLNPRTKGIIKFYITFVLPSAGIATIGIIFYLK